MALLAREKSFLVSIKYCIVSLTCYHYRFEICRHDLVIYLKLLGLFGGDRVGCAMVFIFFTIVGGIRLSVDILGLGTLVYVSSKVLSIFSRRIVEHRNLCRVRTYPLSVVRSCELRCEEAHLTGSLLGRNIFSVDIWAVSCGNPCLGCLAAKGWEHNLEVAIDVGLKLGVRLNLNG